MKRSVVARLQDMLVMIDVAAELIEGCDLAASRADLRRRLAIERCVEIVSEASRQRSRRAEGSLSRCPWPEIAAVGNKLRDEYDRIDDVIFWRVAQSAPPALRPVVAALLAEEGG